MQEFRQSSTVFEKPGILSEKCRTLMSSNYHRVSHIFQKCCTRFLLTNVYKRVLEIFFIWFRSLVIWQNQKRPGFYTLKETRFINNPRSIQNKKFLNTVL